MQMNIEPISITVEINGTVNQLKVMPHHTLAVVIREQLGLLGTKIS